MSKKSSLKIASVNKSSISAEKIKFSHSVTEWLMPDGRTDILSAASLLRRIILNN